MKIVALVPARNEGRRMEFCLRAAAQYCDAIVYLDDCSTDDTPEIVESLARECRVERIIRKREWLRDEPGDRNAILKAGREIGGTHFIVLDADEAFTANCATNGFLRRLIAALQPGDQLAMNWIQLWRSVLRYRFDNSVWTWNRKPFVFCDDGNCSYTSEFIHTPRVPANLAGKCYSLPGYTHGLLHFQFVNWRNLLVKQAWYRCLERIRDPQKPAVEINKRYAPSKDETELRVRPAPSDWFSAYPFFDPSVFDLPDRWRETQILGWFQEFGRQHFQELDIWDIDWGADIPPNASATIRSSDLAGNLEQDDIQLARRYLQKAEEQFTKGALPQARDLLRLALNYDPASLDLTLALGNILSLSGEFDAARWEFLRAAALHTNSAVAHAKWAFASLQLKRYAEFESALGKALEIDANCLEALKLLGDANFHEGRFDDAARSYAKILQHAPDDVETLLPLGICFFKKGDWETAECVFDRILRVQPNHALAKENLGVVQRKLSSRTKPDTEPSIRSSKPSESEQDQSGTQQSITELGSLSLDAYSQPVAGLVEKWIAVRPIRSSGGTRSSYQALKNYPIRNFGDGLPAVEAVLNHIARYKFKTPLQPKSDFWRRTVAVSVLCELRSVVKNSYFDELGVRSVSDISPELVRSEPSRTPEIERYAERLRAGADLGCPLYVTGRTLNELMRSAPAEEKGIYMIDGARRLTASALAHRRSVNIVLLMTEEEFASLLLESEKREMQERLGDLAWFNNYQSIPLVGLQGQRSLNRFNLIDMARLRDQTVLDFGCNIGQACFQAVQAGAGHVTGIEGMADTFAIAEKIRRMVGFQNLQFLNVDFNRPDFDRVIDEAHPRAVDFSFFFSVYRTKELKQRDRLFQYIIDKTRQGIFFEGHAHPVIDTLEYYAWLFDCFGLKHRFLGYSESKLRPLFYLPLREDAKLASGMHHGSRGQAAHIDELVQSSPSHLTSPMTVESKVCMAASRNAITEAAEPAEQQPLSTSSAKPDEYLVSAIVSVYRCEKFIDAKLHDLLRQTLGNRLEIILIDSNSPDNEGQIIQKFAARHANVKYVRTPKRESLYQAWNRGIRLASGKYITNSNSDDRLHPDALAVMAQELDRHPEVGLVYGDFFITSFANMTVENHVRCGYSLKPDYGPDIMLGGCHIGPQPMWRKSVHDEIGYFNEQYVVAGDYEFWCRLASRYSLKHIPSFLGLYFHNPTGIANGNKETEVRETAQIQKIYANKFPAPRQTLPTGYYFTAPVERHRYVNVCIVTYNRLKYTRQAIQGLLRYTRFPHVITVVDNASQDGTREYLKEIKAQGIVKNLILLDENIGVAKASNLAWSQEPLAEYYLKFDNDIVLQKPDWLEKMVQVAEAIPQIGVLGYNFEPVSFPLRQADGVSFRLKERGNIGGACLLIPKRTQRRLGVWCEDYGLYGEEDADYGVRVSLARLWNAYMEDENIGVHLPSGKAAPIDSNSLVADDPDEIAEHPEYRRWKDEQRRKNVFGARFQKNLLAYRSGTKSLFAESEFVKRHCAAEETRESAGAPVADADKGVVDPPSRPTSVAAEPVNIRGNAKAMNELNEILQWADREYRNGDFAAARSILSKAVNMAPNDSRILASLGAVSFMLGDLDAAQEHLTAATTAKPDDPFLYVQLAGVLLKLGKIDEFEAALARALELDPFHRDALKLLADLNLQNGRFKDAAEVYVKILRRHLDDPEALLPLGVCFVKLNDLETAKTVFERLLERQPDHALGRENLAVVCQKLEEARAGSVDKALPESTPCPSLERARQDDYATKPASSDPGGMSTGVPSAKDVAGGSTAKEALKKPAVSNAPQLIEQASFFNEAGNREAALESLQQAAELAPNDPKILSALGSFHYTMGNYEAAREQFRRLIELRPRDPDAYAQLAMSCLRLSRIEEMESALGIALEINPDHREALRFLAKTNLEQNRVRDAGRAYAKLLEKKPDDLESLLSLGLCFYRGNEWDAARMVYQRVLEFDSKNATAQENLFQIERLKQKRAAGRTGQFPGASANSPGNLPEINRWLRKADAAFGSQNLAAARDALRSALELAPNSPEILSALGSLCFQLGEMTDARDYLKRLVEHAATDSSKWVQLALAHYQLGEIEPFESALARALELNPNQLEALRLLAHLNFNHGSVADAAQAYGKILKQTPDDLEVILALGVCFFKTSDYESALMMFERALELDPNNAVAKENLEVVRSRLAEPTKSPAETALPGRPASEVVESLLAEAEARLAEGNLQAASTGLKQAQNLAPGNAEIAATYGSVLFQLGEWERSRDAIRRAVQLRGDSPDFQTRLALVSIKLGCVADFESALARALELAPNYAPALKLQADLNFQSGRIPEAARLYHRILQTQPDDIDALLPLGVCFYQTGDLATAKTVFERVLELQPQNDLAKQNLEIISRKLAVAIAEPGAPTANISVSIIIPVFNQLHFTRRCLETIRGQGPGSHPYEIIVVDNGSSDGTREYLQSLQPSWPALRYERNEANVGFAKANNHGARLARGEFLLFLNNDTEPQPNWLEALVTTLAGDSTTAAAGSKLLYPDGRIQHAGVEIVDDQSVGDPLLARNALVGKPGDVPEANQRRVCQAVTAACLIVRKSCFERVGGFDEEFWNGYEDVDLCFKLQEQGWSMVYQPQSVVIHHESKSGAERFRNVRQNISRLHQKWLGKIIPDQTITKSGEVVSKKKSDAQADSAIISIGSALTPNPAAPLVSIVILTFNQLEHTRKCLASLDAHTPERHELILVDNGSTDGTVEYLEGLQAGQKAKVIFNSKNRGFSAGNNQGLAVAQGDFLLLLNNDTVVTPDWLARLLAVFERNPAVGVVGPVSNYVSGPQQVLEVDYRDLNDLPGFARGWSARHHHETQEIHRVVGFCLMARRAVVDAIGGLDERFGSGNFEDDDFCIRARLAGYKAVVARDVFIHHTGSATFRGANINYLDSLRRNWELFKSKWNLPPQARIEHGYRSPQGPFDPTLHFLPLPAPDPLEKPSPEVGAQVEMAPTATTAVKFEAPPVARLGSLQRVHDWLAQKKYLKAWKAALAAIELRPFHPDAYLQMADIALTAGDEEQAFLCAERLIQMTPNWDTARKVYDSLSQQKFRRQTRIRWAPLPPLSDKPRLSVCLIVKNEEEYLGRCLASVKPIASQIVVVDTGSTDRTVEIAKEHGAEVYHFVWNDHFADARNAAHQYARGDWVLILDADEELPPESHGKLARDMAVANVLGYRIPICNLNEADDAVTYVPRLFRNAPALFFVSRVHEQIYASILARKTDWNMDAELGTATIVHHGYDPGLVQRRQKIKRNLKLLEQAIEELPNEAALIMNYGLDLVNDGQLEAGLEQYRKAYRIMVPYPPDAILPEVRERLMTLFGVHLMRARRFEEVVEIMTSRLARDCGPTASISFLAALALMKLGRTEEAVAQLRICLERRHIPPLTPPCREVQKSGPNHLLGECLAKLEQNAEAEAQFKIALEQEPQAPGLIHDYAHFLHRRNRSVEALEILHQAVTNGVPDERLWHLGGFIANSKAEFLEFGLEWTSEALRFFPEHPGIRGFRGETLLKAGRIDQALPFFEQMAQSDKPEVRAAVILCRLVLDRLSVETPPPDEVKVSAEFIAWYRRLLATNAKASVTAVNARIDALRRVLPAAAALLEKAVRDAQAE